jgi:5-carboxymethyl-2-hydroxymuconate isomerase
LDAERRSEEEAMSVPKIETVNAVTMEHAETLIDVINETIIASGAFIDGFSEAAILTWPDDYEAAQKQYNRLADEIRDRLFADTRPFIAETFVRIANAVIEGERTRVEESLIPPRVETVETVTPEHGLIFAEHLYRETADSEIFFVSLSATHTMTFPDDGPHGEESAAQTHFHDLTYEIRERLHDETKQLIADAFVRVVSDVFSRERQRR